MKVGVEREVRAADRRIDLVLRWGDGSATSVEVKIGDENLEKTFEAIERCEQTFPRCAWTHFVLLLREQIDAWLEVEERLSSAERLPRRCKVLTWDDVAQALRQRLWAQAGSLLQLTFVTAYCGAIEQRLLDLPPLGERVFSQYRELAQLLRRRRLLEQGRIP